MENTVVLKSCKSGLGMKICGGQIEDGTYTGIFVKKILLGGAVASNGTLQEGDELLAANGQDLQLSNNDKAVAILRNASQSGMVKIVFRRDEESRSKLEKLFPPNNDSIYSLLRQKGMGSQGNDISLSRSDSVSSRISATSFEKRAWVCRGDGMSPAPLKEQSVNVDSPAKGELFSMESLDLPPSPLGLDPGLPKNNLVKARSSGIQKIKEQVGDLERASSFDSGFPSSGRFPSPDLTDRDLADSMPVMKIDVPAKTNLGISITGGKNKPDGPCIYVKDVIEGCDAYLDGRIRKGDRIIAINDEPFTDVTYEQARSILLRLKLQKDLSVYKIKYVVNPELSGALKQLQNSIPASAYAKPIKFSDQSRPAFIPSTVDELSQEIVSSPNNDGSLMSQSSDEEAVIKELIKMMENSNEFETQPINHSKLSISNSSEPGNRSKEQYTDQRRSEDQSFGQNVSRQSVFNPSKHSSPEERSGNGDMFSRNNLDSNGRKTITQYLEEDLNERLPSKSTLNASVNQSRSRRTRGRRLSLDPTTKIRVEKLEVALNYLGYETSPSNIRKIRQRVNIDRNGFVTYGDFVAAARQVVDLRLNDGSRTLSENVLRFAVKDIEEVDRENVVKNDKQRELLEKKQQQLPMESPSQASLRMSLKEIEALEEAETKVVAKRESEHLAEMQAANRRIQDDLARVARERDDAIRELQYFKRQMNERNQNGADMEDQLDRSRQETANAHREVSELRTRTHLVSTALQEAKQREQHYEQTIEKLKEDVETGKSKNNNLGPKQREFNELQKRLVVLGCQLRKTEVSKRTYEVAVEKLTKFAQHVQDAAENEKNSSRPSSRSNSVKKSKAPPPPAVDSLALEARDTIRAVKLLLEEEPLPFGWEEVYSPDGTRYYINHVTQTTSWLHPISGIQVGAAENRNAPPPSDQKF